MQSTMHQAGAGMRGAALGSRRAMSGKQVFSNTQRVSLRVRKASRMAALNVRAEKVGSSTQAGRCRLGRANPAQSDAD